MMYMISASSGMIDAGLRLSALWHWRCSNILCKADEAKEILKLVAQVNNLFGNTISTFSHFMIYNMKTFEAQ